MATDLENDPSEQEEDETQPLQLEVKVDSPSACERHLTVIISREDVDRYLDEAYSEMMPNAVVPGFRQGRAPRKLVEQKFSKDVAEQVKGQLLVDSLAQVSEEQNLTAISEPDLDIEAVEVPDEGPMTFEFDIEVRPEFDLPEWQGLPIEREASETTDADVDARLEEVLSRRGKLVPIEGAAEAGDFLTVNIRSKHDGKELDHAREEVIRVQPVLSLRDSNLEGFDKLMTGVKADETRTAEVTLTQDAPNEALRGEKVSLEIEVLDVKRLELPEITPEFLESIGGFESEEELRELVRKDIERQQQYREQQQARRQVSELLTESANWDLPPSMLRRQSARELERSILELRRSGFSDQEIRAHENELRRNSAASTAQSLKEHFILERIAEEHEIEATDNDYDMEVALIAAQSNESPRRVRARLDKQGMMDALRNQIVERKVIELVLSQAEFKDVTKKKEGVGTMALDWAAGGGDSPGDIPSISEPEAAEE
jgi:trigger factor